MALEAQALRRTVAGLLVHQFSLRFGARKSHKITVLIADRRVAPAVIFV